MSNMATANGGGTSLMRQGFGENSIETKRETAQTAAAEQARAIINARFIVAMQRPRDFDTVRSKLLHECKRPLFAERAFFSIPRGNKPGRLTRTPNRIEGLSVRYVEAAVRIMGNIWQDTATIYDDERSRIVRVAMTDLENNSGFSRDLTIVKTTERRTVRDGQIVLSQRKNSAGDTVYEVVATEDELLQREGALISKTFRTEGIRLIPADIIDESEQQIIATINDKDAKDPDAARKQIADAFHQLNVLPGDLKAYLGHDLAQSSPAELRDLRGLWAAIRDGETTWAEIMAERGGEVPAASSQQGDASMAAPQAEPARRSRGSAVASRVRGQSGAPAPAQQPAGPPRSAADVENNPPPAGVANQPPFGDKSQESAAQQPTPGRPVAGQQPSLLGGAAAPAATTAQPAQQPQSIADERAARIKEQEAMLAQWPKEPSVYVTWKQLSGREMDSKTTELAGMFGDFACVRIEGVDNPVPLQQLRVRERAEGED